MNIIAPDNAAEAAAAKLRDPSLNCGLSDTVVVKLNRSGVRYKEGEQAILEAFMGGNNNLLMPIRNKWRDLEDNVMSDEELNAELEKFEKRIYTDTLDGRDALTSGPPYPNQFLP